MLTPRVVVALLAGIAGVALAASLGNWQTRRGDEKAARQAQWDEAVARAPTPITGPDDASGVAGSLPQRVEMTGTFVTRATVYVDNRLVDGVAGFQVVTPVAVAEGMPWILVNRGWAARSMADRTRLPVAPVANAPLRVEGIAVPHVARALEQTNDTGDGLRRAWARPDAGVDKHRGYAFQWYSLATLIAVLTLYFGGRALRRK
jgi:surfeit locus 1 family protein